MTTVAEEPSSRDRHSYPPVPASARSARELVRETLRLHGLDHRAAQVLVSELAVNAIRHARTDFTVRVLVVDDTVRLEVGDGEITLDGLEVAPVGRQTFGLRLVDAFSQRWGVEPEPTGKVVWCELVAHPAVPR